MIKKIFKILSLPVFEKAYWAGVIAISALLIADYILVENEISCERYDIFQSVSNIVGQIMIPLTLILAINQIIIPIKNKRFKKLILNLLMMATTIAVFLLVIDTTLFYCVFDFNGADLGCVFGCDL